MQRNIPYMDPVGLILLTLSFPGQSDPVHDRSTVDLLDVSKIAIQEESGILGTPSFDAQCYMFSSENREHNTKRM